MLCRTNDSWVGVADPGAVCETGAALHSLSRAASPWLYPCLAQYSLLAAATTLAMWTRCSQPSQVSREGCSVVWRYRGLRVAGAGHQGCPGGQGAGLPEGGAGL